LILSDCKKTNVLIVGPSNTGLKGGQATHVDNLMNAFISEADIKTYFYSSSSGLENTENLVVKAFRLIRTILVFPFHLRMISVVHLNSSFDNKALIRDFFLLLWSGLFLKKTLIQYHGGDPFEVSLTKTPVFSWVYSYFWKRCKILILNDNQKQWFQEQNIKDVLRVKNYVRLPKLAKHKDNKLFKFVYIGRVIKEKGLLEIVEAVQLLKDKDNFHVHIYGHGEDYSSINQAIKESNLQNRVTLEGSVELDEKNEVLAGADAFLYPSYYPEGLPYAVLEALSYAVPVICTDAGALSYVVVDKFTCLKVKKKSSSHLAEQMDLLMSDNVLRSRLADSSRKLIVDKYSVNVMKSLFLRLWKNESKNDS